MGRFETNWQEKLQPFMMIMLTGLTFFLLGVSAFQVYSLQQKFDQTPNLDLTPILAEVTISKEEVNLKNKFDYLQWKILSSLENNALQRRYHQANVLIISRMWARFLGFTAGAVLCLVGATFILGKLRENASQLSTENTVLNLTVASTSPGLILAGLGALILIAAMLVDTQVNVDDGIVYLRVLQPQSQVTPPKEFPPIMPETDQLNKEALNQNEGKDKLDELSEKIKKELELKQTNKKVGSN